MFCLFYLFEEFITLLQFLRPIFDHSAGTVVFLQPLLIGALLQVHIRKAQRP